MILNSDEIANLGIVRNAVERGKKPTTYNATVGEIISEGVRINKSAYTLPRRGIVWVVSNEDFQMPNNITGLATLRTSWTHRGILALNVGIVDPEWSGPLSTALVNFSDRPFPIRKGDQFLRVLFHQHNISDASASGVGREDYIHQMEENSKLSTKTFLSISNISNEVYSKIFRAPVWGVWAVYLSVLALSIAIISMFFPVAYGIGTTFIATQSDSAKMRNELDAVKAQQAADHQTLSHLAH